MKKNEIFSSVEEQQEKLFDLSCRIFDNPESDGKEYFAADLLSKTLEAEGFAVERGVGGMETAFRATWSNGEGGPNIGLLGEYDALYVKGHACGHHLQTPACIGAAVALKNVLGGTDIPFTLTVYGTPAEETFGGKIIMQENGCFQELDVALGTHAGRVLAGVGGTSMALKSFAVTFKGISSHASGSPYEGRSAADAMFLSFNGIEFMREHVKDGTRMHYTIKEALGPSNVVPARAVGGYTLRSRDDKYLDEIEQRFRDIIEGACLMTETEAELLQRPTFLAGRRNFSLAEVAKENLVEMGVPIRENFVIDGNGSTDFKNVTTIVPGILISVPYCDAPSHSQEWADAGKTEMAEACLLTSTKILAAVMYDLIMKPELIQKAKDEFHSYD